MNNLNNYQVSPIELSVTLISTTFSVGILTMPRAIAQEVGTADGWISIIVSGIISMAIVYLFVRIQRHFPGQNLFEFIKDGKVSRGISILLSILFLFYFLLVIPFQVRIFGFAVKMYLLDQTPIEVIIGSMLIVVFYAVSKGIQGIIHINLMFVPIILTVLLMGIAFNIGHAKLTIFLPILSEGMVPIAKGIVPTMYSFINVFIIIFFMGSMKPSAIRVWPINLGVVIIIVMHVLYFIMSVSVFSLEPLKTITFPTIELIKEIEVPGGFFERIESLFITIWVMSVFTTLTLNIIMAQLLLRGSIFKRKKMPWLSAVMAFFIYIIAFIPSSIVEVSKMEEWSAYVAFIATGLALIVGFITVWRKNKKQNKHSPSAGM
jgi:spore germination protein